MCFSSVFNYQSQQTELGCFSNILPEMPFTCGNTETQWANGRLAFLISYWLVTFSRGFFLFTQPIQLLHLETR